VAQRPQEACLVHGASGEGDRLLGCVLGRGDHRKAAHPRRLETLPLGGATIPPTMTPIDGSSKGTHPKIVQEMLGHANISMTMDTYSHVLPDMQEKAVSAMDDALS
jgi:hypothetical protein